ncbi:MAG: response regulator [Candidatus Sericytochromatia bacterium]
MTGVLIVEDSLVSQKVIKLNLEKQKGIEIVGIACNGFEAIKMTKELNPDVIIMDLCMPKMDGIEALNEIIKEMNIPIIFLSAQINMKESALSSGAVSFIEKNSENIKNILLSDINKFARVSNK